MGAGLFSPRPIKTQLSASIFTFYDHFSTRTFAEWDAHAFAACLRIQSRKIAVLGSFSFRQLWVQTPLGFRGVVCEVCKPQTGEMKCVHCRWFFCLPMTHAMATATRKDTDRKLKASVAF